MGFVWNGTHTNDLRLLANLKVKPVIPEPKLITDDIMTVDGIIDFSEYNNAGRIHYKNRVFEFECAFLQDQKKDIAAETSALAAIFMQRTGYLIIDEAPSVRWKAKIINKIDLSKIGIGVDRFTVSFRTEPFSESLTLAEYSFDVTTDQTVAIENVGTWHVKPMIRLEGAIDNLVLHLNEKTFSFYNPSKNNILIDNDKAAVVQGNENLAQYADGDFLELTPGINILDIAGFSGQMLFSFRPRYIWS